MYIIYICFRKHVHILIVLVTEREMISVRFSMHAYFKLPLNVFNRTQVMCNVDGSLLHMLFICYVLRGLCFKT